ILGVYRGYFQAYQNMLPTSVSQILEQIFNAAVSLLAAWLFIRYLSDGTAGQNAKWGAAGSTVGTTAGVVVALLFMLLVYGLNRRGIQTRVARDRSHREQSYRQILKLIVLIVSPIILSAFIYNVNGYLNGLLYSEILGRQGADADALSMMYAEYATYFMSIINIPLTLSSAAPTSMIPEISALYAVKDMKETRRRIDQTVQLSMFISVPCAVGLATLSQPIVSFLFGGSNGVAGKLLMLGSFTILLNGMSNISNGVLQGIGKPKIPMITAAAALVVDVVAVVLLLIFTDLGIYSLLVAMIIYAVVVCILNDIAMKKYLRYKNPWKSAYLNPVLASVPMCAVAGLTYYGLYRLIRSNAVCLILAVILAAAVYLLVYLLLEGPSREKLSRMPGGAYLVKIAGKLHGRK
ncbi:MAG TPA: polysaccharide biosynthesis C-terminal domain-containing protein, partial [Candidatus Blautia intestinipullorum]|nr:polysaccharide biosynthesis C-terminal domain-containing protein [Candidatus Blautia intestinipullorum]